jgi:NAD(P)-dependent dehydrogenase (short-subunit alcohol dehydrogenase family)
MEIAGTSTLVTGGASGLGLGTARALAKAGAKVTILDLEGSAGTEVAAEIGGIFVATDVRDTAGVEAALDAAESQGPLRAVVHCAGRGGPVRIVEKDGTPGSLEKYNETIQVNLVGSFNVLRLAATRMARTDAVDGERGVVIMTASVAAYEGQIGQIPYASSKAGIVGMTIVAARDLASKQIRVCTIAPGLFETPPVAALREDVRGSLARSVPHPSRFGVPDEYARLALAIIDNPMLNGETIRIDGAIRMAPR